MSDLLIIRKGETFRRIVRWETSPPIFKTITGATKAAPCVLTSANHGMPDGWRVRSVTSVVGMKEINTKTMRGGYWERSAIGDAFPDGFRRTSVPDVNTVKLLDVNASGFTTYASGGILEYNTPVDLNGYTAAMQFREYPESATALLSLVSPTNIVIDNTLKTITITITDEVTAAITWSRAVTSLEMTLAGEVSILISDQDVTVLETDITRP